LIVLCSVCFVPRNDDISYKLNVFKQLLSRFILIFRLKKKEQNPKATHPLIFREILSVTMILFAIIDILGAIPVIIQVRQRVGHIESEKASIAVLVLMIVFLFVGDELLGIIGLDISSFAIAGSLVIFIIAMEMILGVDFFKEEIPTSASIVPLAFPLIAGAGTMTTLLSLKSQYQTQNIIVGIVINTLFVYLVLKNVKWIEKLLGPVGLAILRKSFGIILLAIAIKLFRSNTHL
jgi:multiple antibiotic resistance protein